MLRQDMGGAGARLVACGANASPSGSPLPQIGAVVRLLENGALDATFGGDGVVDTGNVLFASTNRKVVSAWVASWYAMVLQPDGKVVVAGPARVATKTSAQDAIALARFTGDGALDATFGRGGVVLDDLTSGHDRPTWYDLALQPATGKLVVNVTATRLVRYLPDGTRDGSFANPAVAGGAIGSVQVDAAGRLLTSGVVNLTGGGSNLALRRYTADGHPDLTFGGGDGVALLDVGATDVVPGACALQGDGRILVGLSAAPSASSQYDSVGYVARFLEDGTLDVSYGTNGLSSPIDVGDYENQVQVAVLDPAGDLCVLGRALLTVGTSHPTDAFLVRLLGN
jgi:uncharacterized delta-60 repeat protein